MGTGGAQFGIKVKGLTVDCNGASACTTGILNNAAQEDSTVEDVIINNAPSVGLRVTANCFSGCVGAVNSGPYRNITIQYSSSCGGCGSNTIGLRVDGIDDGSVIRGFDNITVSGPAPGSYSYGILVLGASTRIVNSHVEKFSNGIQIGDNSGTIFTKNVQVENVSIGGVGSTGWSITIYPYSGDIVLSGIASRATNNQALNDLAGGFTLSTSDDAFLGFYALGHCSSFPCTQGAYPGVISTSNQVSGGIHHQ